MARSQADVDRVMAAFGSDPIRYRANQERANSGGESASQAFETAALRHGHEPARTEGEQLPPGAGGAVRDVFPLLARAVPSVAGVAVAAVKRPGDEVPKRGESDEAVLPFGLDFAAALSASAETPPPAAAPQQTAPSRSPRRQAPKSRRRPSPKPPAKSHCRRCATTRS